MAGLTAQRKTDFCETVNELSERTLNPRFDVWFLTSLMLYALLSYISSEAYSLKSTPNNRIFEKVFMIIFCQKSDEPFNLLT